MDYSANIELRTERPLTADDLAAVAALGGAATGNEGGHQIGTTFTVTAPDLASAAPAALARLHEIIDGDPVAIEVTTLEEADRRLDEPPFPELAGVAEVAELLGVSRQRASELQTRHDFPAPVAVLRSGPVWRRGDLTRFNDTWERKPGRPRKASSATAPR